MTHTLTRLPDLGAQLELVRWGPPRDGRETDDGPEILVWVICRVSIIRDPRRPHLRKAL